MPDINQLQINGTVYDLADEASRDELASVKSAIADTISEGENGLVLTPVEQIHSGA